MDSRLGRMVVALGAAACVVVTTSCSSDGDPSATPPASSAPATASSGEEGGGAYLALGDSVPFGFRGGATAEFSDPENFVGYPELVGEKLAAE